MATGRKHGRPIRTLRYLARVIFVLWAAFWIYFNLASGIGESAALGIMALIMHLFMPLIALVTLYFVWVDELAGGVLLLLEAVVYAYFFHSWDWPLVALLPLPLALCGVLLLVCWVDGRFSQAHASRA